MKPEGVWDVQTEGSVYRFDFTKNTWERVQYKKNTTLKELRGRLVAMVEPVVGRGMQFMFLRDDNALCCITTSPVKAIAKVQDQSNVVVEGEVDLGVTR